ncbi:MAG: beta-glucosidase [Dehalococcoidales bacterium]|nr:beta-glucosidase [Dehalococcoidales bacterium]
MAFPKDFIWGAAAASYQVEGGAFDDGKGLSVWDMMTHEPDRVWENNTGDVSCDHYHRYKEDAALMGEIGLKAYRLSVCWPRVMPEGTGKVNEKGLDFYDKLVDALLENGVEPWVTLFHWDYPYSLYLKGGWMHPDSSEWFAEYTKVIVDRISDRVSHWMTLNEPQVFIDAGHRVGRHAPGIQLGFKEVLTTAHNALLSHGKAARVIRADAKKPPLIGAAPVGVNKIPATESQKDIDTARKMTFAITEKNLGGNTWFADPMILGRYPEDGLKLFEAEMPDFDPDDMKTICQPVDFYGVNIYRGDTVSADSEGPVPAPDGDPVTTMDWHITPESLYWGPKFLYERYNLPLVITENGMANMDWVHLDGKVHDPQRIDFLTRYLRQLERASQEVPVQGYMYWSIMDNFEWAEGYKQRFGLIHCDYPTGKRTLKDSAYWYKEVIATNGENLLK